MAAKDELVRTQLETRLQVTKALKLLSLKCFVLYDCLTCNLVVLSEQLFFKISCSMKEFIIEG